MSSESALMLDGLTVSFGGFKAVDSFSMTINEGELRVVLGPNGAGKTTMMDLVSGKTAATDGHVYLFGKKITNWPEHRIARAGIGRKFQIPSVFRDLTVRDNLRVAVSEEVGVLRNLRFGLRPRETTRYREIVEVAGLDEIEHRRAGDLSHGQMQWLELGLLMAQDARVLLLDEPTAGMTQGETRKTSEIVNRLKGRHTLLVVEHDLSFVRAIAETVTVMHMGKFLAQGSMADIEANAAVRDAYLGSGGVH
jgi:urea transport system ATP-binding protein